MSAGQLEYGVLGSLDVRRDGEPVEVGGGRQRGLLGLLLVARRDVVSADALLEALWPAGRPKTAPTVLQGYVSQLRKALEPERTPGVPPEVLVTEPGGYRLRVENGNLDADRFEQLLRSATDAGGAHEKAQLLEEALGLWRGPPLADFGFESWAQPEVGRLEELRLVAREELLEARLELGHHAEAVAGFEALVAENPLRERPRRLLMLALYRSGRQAEALAVYHRMREQLLDELGIDPSPALQELHRQILNQDASLAPPPVRPATPETNIPAAATELVGRSRELEELADLLTRRDVRLVTLTGPGGTGKTRLAVAVAAARVPDEPDGAWFVDLSSLRDPQLVLPEIARTLAGREDLDGFLDGKRLLLVLDNFEQVVEAALPVARLLQAAPGVRMLVTSREPLRVQGEHEYPVQPLAEDDAVTLFVQRAQAVSPSFEPKPDVAQICRRLDGLPLAIQLAAARVKLLPTATILDRLERRLALLTHGARDLPERQQTLRAAIAWSHDLLTDEERQTFEALAVFTGGFTPEAAEEVCGVQLDLLAALVDRSLVRVRAGRFSMLETIREFALEQLDAKHARELRDRHARFYFALAKRCREEVEGLEQARWLQEFELELDNVRSALAWTLEEEPERALHLAIVSGRSWGRIGYFGEGSDWLERALAACPEADAELRAEAFGVAGSMRIWLGELDGACALMEEAIALWREVDNPEALLWDLNNLAVALIFADESDRAAPLLAESRALAERIGDRVGVAAATHNLGDVALSNGDFAGAEACYTAALGLTRELGHTYGCALSIECIAAVRLEAADYAGAAAVLPEALALARELDEPLVTAHVLGDVAVVAAARDRPDLAARLLGTAERLRSTFRIRTWRLRVERVDATEQEVRAALGDEAWELEAARGRSLDAAAAVEQALEAIVSPAPA